MSNGREIIRSIVGEKRCPERMGLFEHYWDDTQREWENQGLPKETDFVDFFDYDIKPIAKSWFQTSPFYNELRTIEETDETYVYVDGWGATKREWRHKAGTPEHIRFDLTSEQIWREKYREPLLYLDKNRFGNLDELKQNFRMSMNTDRFVVYTNIMVFEIMRVSMGDVEMLESMYLNPRWIHDFCDVVTNMIIRHYDYMFREVGIPDGMFIYEDMGYTYGPFCSPEMQREMVFPYHKRFVDFVHDYKIPFIMHSCGKIRPFLKSIVDAGVDCLQVLEAKAGQDVREMADATDNKIAFMGNLNIIAFETNNRKELEKEIIPKLNDINLKRIPYVFHSDHSIPKTVKLKTYKYALELFKKHGKYQTV
jgi:uroporphyrinogen decarboxylase